MRRRRAAASHAVASFKMPRAAQRRSAALAWCERRGAWSQALAILRRMEADTSAYNAAMGACRRANRWKQALSLLDEMPESLVTQKTLRTAIAACEQGGQWRRGLELLRRAPCVANYNSVVAACEAAGEEAAAEAALERGLGLYEVWTEQGELDLHDMSVPVARTLVRLVVRDTVRWPKGRYFHDPYLMGDLVIITGRGHRSEAKRPLIKPAILRLLASIPHLRFRVHPRNPGRVVVDDASLLAYARRTSWKARFRDLVPLARYAFLLPSFLTPRQAWSSSWSWSWWYQKRY
ncbi:hypothetical protein CTAYLR_000547 [Chrysophaeum taylorii]|uniref:Smr domain-containing protein n=1 Tax=Chrysophaeum taylorii TaxID=2483200 RepID=A0AAD7UGY2_9STRA|nr:hypothetical protein CTAYLR_000547 [Chrysophaeum taylorii]